MLQNTTGHNARMTSILKMEEVSDSNSMFQDQMDERLRSLSMAERVKSVARYQVYCLQKRGSKPDSSGSL
jgi:hypothetical protein